MEEDTGDGEVSLINTVACRVVWLKTLKLEWENCKDTEVLRVGLTEKWYLHEFGW